MKAKSCFSTDMDPYRAGIEIGEGLADIHPEVIFLFPTIHIGGSPELLEAIFEALDPQAPALIGNTGDGFYERGMVAHAGVSALGISTGGAVKWHVAHEPGMSGQPREATRRCLARVNQMCGVQGPRFHFLVTDFRTDTSEIVEAVSGSAKGPVIGGSAADDYTFKRCFVYADREVLTDSIAVLAAEGPIAFDIRVAHDLQPMGRPGVITDSEGTTVRAIGGIPAMDFVERELGKPVGAVDEGIMTLKIMQSESSPEHRIRSLMLPRGDSGETGVKLFGGIKSGECAQLCLASPERIRRDVSEIGDSLGTLPFEPLAALIVSCAGRKRVLADSIDCEVREIVRACPSLQALAGFPSFGEFGPVRTPAGYSAPLFHNMTFILLLLGETAG